MKTAHIIAAAALTLLAAVGAQAETYDGVQQIVSVKSRAAVDAEAVAAAHAPDQNINRSSKVAPALPSPTSRTAVAAEAGDLEAVRYALAACLTHLGREEEAKAHLEALLGANPENGEAQQLYARFAA